ncbi:hypothetical protein EVAR_2602_1 [Eumeta japonica]|uniref:Uncharacterized protein n=1 Tax=Eumeta variegata TaxID=151549 RepID=A0A4C1SLY4_EUMVA|nr:hypothetical protein EVAR_2602_1 [Eumeta japonica]
MQDCKHIATPQVVLIYTSEQALRTGRRPARQRQVSTRCTEYGICKFLQVTVAELLKILSAYIDKRSQVNILVLHYRNQIKIHAPPLTIVDPQFLLRPTQNPIESLLDPWESTWTTLGNTAI